MSTSRFRLGNIDSLPDITVKNYTDWKKDDYNKSIISPLPQRSWYDRFFCCFRGNKIYN